MPARDPAAGDDEVTIFAASNQHAPAGHADRSSRPHLAERPWRDVVRVDVGNGPLRAGPSRTSRSGGRGTDGDFVRATRRRYFDRQVEDQPVLADLEVRIVEQFHRRGAEDFSVDANWKARRKTTNRRPPVAAHEYERRRWHRGQHRQQHAALAAPTKQVSAEAKLAVLAVEREVRHPGARGELQKRVAA